MGGCWVGEPMLATTRLATVGSAGPSRHRLLLCGHGKKGTQGKWKRDGNGAPRCDLEIFKLKVLHDVLLNGVLGLEAKPLHVALRVVTRQSSAARGAGQRVNPLV
jgi:hypothetical protein